MPTGRSVRISESTYAINSCGLEHEYYSVLLTVSYDRIMLR